jgi:glycosyltransferase involved in cell wall biosynthesis
MQSPPQAAPIRVAVVQDGARLHYAVPLALQRAGCLRLMFSEWFIKRGGISSKFLRVFNLFDSRKMRALLERRCDEILPSVVRTNAVLAYRQKRELRRQKTKEAAYQWSSAATGKWIRHVGVADANVLMGFIRNIDPLLCQWARQRGVLTVGDQIIAPSRIEAKEASIQAQRFPDFEPPGDKPDYDLVTEVEEATWRELDRITCASEYVRQGLREQGIAEDRIHVAPYPVDAGKYFVPDRKGRRGPLLVGFVGAVSLRKGAPYFFEVAKRLAGPNLKFVMVGPVQFRDEVIRSRGDRVEVVGRMPRSQVADWLGRFDIFLFPSTCEGSAGAAMEAMACGLPIVASPNSGTIVREGVDGFNRNYDDIDALAECVQRLAGDENLRLEMGREARRQAELTNIDRYGEQLRQIIQSVQPARI